MINQPENQESKPSKDNITEPPYVSVVIPAKNEEQYLPRCLNALQHLDYPKDRIEIILVDNGSTDKTVEIAQSYKVKVLTKKEGTIGAIRNYGVQHAQGIIIGFVDADVVVSEKWLTCCLEHFSTTDAGAVTTPMALPARPSWVEKSWLSLDRPTLDIIPLDTIATFNVLIRKEVFLKVGGFNESLQTCEDSDLGYRIKKYCNILLDTRISTIHLGQTKTLMLFFRKELWRGAGNIKNLFTHNFNIKEVPSIVCPLIYVICMLFLPFFLYLTIMDNISARPVLLCCMALLLLLPLLFMIVKKRFSLSLLPAMFVLSSAYLLARGIAMLKSLLILSTGFMIRNKG